LLAGVLLVAGWVAAGALLWRTAVPDLDLPELDPGAFFPAEELARIHDYRSVTRALWAASTGLGLAVAGLAAWRGRALAARLRPLAHGRIRTGLAVGVVVVAAVFVVTLPLAGVGHWWRRRYGLSTQGWGGWLGDQLLALGVRAILVSICVAGVLWLAGRLGRRWWLVGGPALATIGVLFVLVQPLVIEPLFNRFEPLRDRALAADIRELAAREGVSVGDVEVADASRRTTAANAYVTGIGPTKHVVLYDTTLDGDLSRGELLALVAHELAHVARSHLWKGAAWFALLAVPGVFLLANVLERRFGGAADPANVPLGLLVALALVLATQPLANVLSRRYEAEADWLALRATDDPGSAVRLDRSLALSGLGDPDPPDWARLWLSTHPSTMDRIAMALRFRDASRTPAGS
jgi:STE24 endopeptidase